jgi:hypothetical protein
MHKEKKFCFNYCQIQKTNEMRNATNKKKKLEEKKKYVKSNCSKAHTYKRIRVHSLLPVIVVAYNVP